MSFVTSRREFLGALSVPVGAAAVGLSFGVAEAIGRELAAVPGTPSEIAGNEDFWMQVQQAFTVDRNITNLNNGGVSPAPAVVQEAMKRHLDFQNSTPPPVSLWR